jgi:AmiR/NasT family two-component response regulator
MKRVWIVDKQHWPRALLRGELLERGLEVIGFESLENALVSLELAATPRPDIIIVELKGLGGGDDERLARLAGEGWLIMLLGGEVELYNEVVRSGKWAAILKRPFTIGQVVQAVCQQIQASS